MNAQLPATRSGDAFELSVPDFDAIAAIALREFGLSLPGHKRQLVQSRLSRRLRSLKLPDFHAYRVLIEGSHGAAERSELLSALTTNVTKFFREIHHFETLVDEIMPQLIARAKKGERVRIWSAGCSSGQEPYSIALTALKCEPMIARTNFKILATDIDPSVVAKARLARYGLEEIEGIAPRFYRSGDILQKPDELANTFTVSAEVQSLVTFGILNLIQDFPFSGSFDVIFCRNVAIYFDKSTQIQVWNRFSRLLPTDGRLFIGHSERIAAQDCIDLAPAGITIYKKV